jgi:hypothetical protein
MPQTLWSQPENLRYTTNSYWFTTLAQFKRAKTQFLYLGSGASPHRRDSSPRSNKTKQPPEHHRETPGRQLSLAPPLGVTPVWLLVVAAASDTWPDDAALRPRDLEHRLNDNARGDHMLMQEAQNQNELHTLAIGPE